MAKEDFCYTHYDGDEARDIAHMNRLERGAYTDIRLAQRKFGRLSLDRIKKILSKDFSETWDSIEAVLKKDDNGFYYIEWLENSIEKMRRHSEKQKNNISKRFGNTKTIPNEDLVIPKSDLVIPLENENENENRNEDVNKDFGKSENLLPKMFIAFKKAKPNYPDDQEKDFKALKTISAFICKQSGISYQPQEPDVGEKVMQAWGIIVNYLSKDNFYNTMSLTSVSYNIQTIVQKIQNESSNSKTSGKPGSKVNGSDLNEAIAKFRNKKQPAGNTG